MKRFFLIPLLLLALGACDPKQNADTKAATLKSAITIGETTYASGAVLVAAYHALTPCGEPGAAKVCYDANSGMKADQLLAGLQVAINTAKGLAAGTDTVSDPVAITTAVTVAALQLIPLLHQLGIL